MISELCWVESCHGLYIEVGHIALAFCAVIYILMKLKLHGTYSTALLNWWIGKSILIFHFTIWQIHCSHCPHQGLESLHVRFSYIWFGGKNVANKWRLIYPVSPLQQLWCWGRILKTLNRYTFSHCRYVMEQYDWLLTNQPAFLYKK